MARLQEPLSKAVAELSKKGAPQVEFSAPGEARRCQGPVFDVDSNMKTKQPAIWYYLIAI